MSLSTSPLYASPLSSRGASTALPADYYVKRSRTGYEVHLDGYGLIDGEFDCYAEAAFAAQAHADALSDEQAEADEAAAEAAYQDELDNIYRVIDAQGGFVEPRDLIGLARVRAVQTVLDLIDGLATKKAA